MEKVFICILSCEKYSHKREIQNTSDLEAEYRYFIGNPSLSQAVEDKNIVYLPCPDSYEYLTHKTLQAFKWMEENIDADFYYKTDDDTIFDKKEFHILHESVVKSKIEYGGEIHRGGGVMSSHHFGKCEDDRINKKRFYVPNIIYAKGGGYVLSKDSLRLINQTDNKQKYFCLYEDATIGNILNSHGILVKHLNIRKSFNWDMIQQSLTEKNLTNKYFIKDGYEHRNTYTHYSDIGYEDQYQDEVYQTALKIMVDNKLKKVFDIGCGSGFKLRKYFSSYDFIGAEINPTLEWLKEEYPDDNWVLSDFNNFVKTDLFICSDVIEHLVDPDNLLNFIQNSDFKFVVLSTPERDAVQKYQKGFTWNGPPLNPAHVREWNFQNFTTTFQILFMLKIIL